MFGSMRSLVIALSCVVLAQPMVGCRKDPDLTPMHPKPGELPPLPPASGTPIGYLIDAQATLQLKPDQVAKLKQLDVSLAAQNDVIDTQLRTIEKPEDEPQDPKAPPRRHNHAPTIPLPILEPGADERIGAGDDRQLAELDAAVEGQECRDEL